MKRGKTLDRHKKKCEVCGPADCVIQVLNLHKIALQLRAPPGDEIYRDEDTRLSVFEVRARATVGNAVLFWDVTASFSAG